MYSLTVNDHVMIAHSLPDEFFGPAQGMHGATLTVEATFTRAELDEHAVVLDIGQAMDMLDQALSPLRYANLDEHPDFAGKLSTTEATASSSRCRPSVPDSRSGQSTSRRSPRCSRSTSSRSGSGRSTTSTRWSSCTRR